MLDPYVFNYIVAVVRAHDDSGGASIRDFEPVGLSQVQIRRYLLDLIKEGAIVRTKPVGRDVRYLLPKSKRRRVMVTVKEGGRKLGEFELDQDYLYGLVGDRKLLPLARRIVEIVGTAELGSSAYATRGRTTSSGRAAGARTTGRRRSR